MSASLTMELINLQNTPTPKTIEIEIVAFKNAEVTLKGTLYKPVKSLRSNPFYNQEYIPSVVVTGAWTTVQEQMAGTYARELALRGMIAMTFDFTGWGKSDGSRRYVEDPSVKTEDIHAAVTYLSHRDEVDIDQIFGLGICASSGYMAEVAVNDDRLSKLAFVAPWLHDPELAITIYGGTDTVNQLISDSEAAEAVNNPEILVAASTTDSSSLMYQAPYYSEKHRGFIPEYDNKFNTLSWKPWLTYNALSSASCLKKPSLMIGSKGMALPAGALAYEQAMKIPIQKLWLADDINQFDFYDRKDIVMTASDAIVKFFKTRNT